jgi:hypothetical protein
MRGHAAVRCVSCAADVRRRRVPPTCSADVFRRRVPPTCSAWTAIQVIRPAVCELPSGVGDLGPLALTAVVVFYVTFVPQDWLSRIAGRQRGADP